MYTIARATTADIKNVSEKHIPYMIHTNRVRIKKGEKRRKRGESSKFTQCPSVQG